MFRLFHENASSLCSVRNWSPVIHEDHRISAGSIHSRRHRCIIYGESGSQRPRRNVPRANRFVQLGESGTTAAPRRVVLRGFPKGNMRGTDKHHLSDNGETVSSTSRPRAIGGRSNPVSRQSLGGELPVVGQDGVSSAGDGSVGLGPKSKDSSSSNIGVSRSYAEGDDSSSDIDSTDTDMIAGNTRAGPMQSSEEVIVLDFAACETTALDRRSLGHGTPLAVEGTPGLVPEASASFPPRTPDRDMTRKSFERAKGKRYDRWPPWLSRFACPMPGIVRMSLMKDVDVLAASTEDGVKLKGRSSPYTEDLYDSCPSEGELFSTKYLVRYDDRISYLIACYSLNQRGILKTCEMRIEHSTNRTRV